MTTADVATTLRKSIVRISSDLSSSIVYLDNSVTYCLSTSIGLSTFLELGALNVHQLSQVSKNDAFVGTLLSDTDTDASPNVVVFIMQLLNEAQSQLVNILQMHPKCRQLTVFCCYSADAHVQLETETFESNAYSEYAIRIRSAANSTSEHGKTNVDVRYCPWLFGTVSSQTFILPRCLSKSFSLGLNMEKRMQTMLYRDTDRQHNVIALSHALVGFASHIGRKLDVFTLGNDARSIGAEIMRVGVPVGFNEMPVEKTAALVLIDRAYDLASPLLHLDTLIDRIISAITQIQAGAVDERSKLIDSGSGVKSESSKKTSYDDLFAAEPRDLPMLRAHLMSRTSREAMLFVRKWVREEIRAAGMRSEYRPKAGAPNKEEFTEAVHLLQKAVKTSKLESVCSLAAFTAMALNTETSTHSELIHSNERQIMNMTATDEVVQYFMDLLLNVSKPTAMLSFEDACSLLAFAYCVFTDDTEEPFNSTEMKLILEALVQCAMSEHHAPVLEQLRSSENELSKGDVRFALQQRLGGIERWMSLRHSLKELRKLRSATSPFEYRPLVQTLVSLILQNKSISDLHHETSTLQGIFEGAGGKGLLSKGLGRLGLTRQQESAVGGHDLAIVFIVGGISLSEVNGVIKEIEENGQGPWKPKIILGSTGLLTPKQTVQQLWNLAK